MNQNTQAIKTDHIVNCRISGMPLISVTNLSGGVWPLVVKFEYQIVHPIYDMEPTALHRKLESLLDQADKQGYQLSENTIQQLQLAVSATLYQMGCLALTKNQSAGLPGTAIIIGSGAPLLKLATWHHKLTKKVALPKYRPSEAWMNFAAWTDACTEIFNQWNGSRRKPEDILGEALEQSVDINKVYKKLDTAKVFNWIATQCGDSVAIGRLATLSSLFCADIVDPLEWLQDDVDDLIEIVAKYCDSSNDIIHYILTRCNNIRATIRDYNSGFTLLTAKDAPSALLDNPEQLAKESDAMQNTLRDLRTLSESLDTLPAAPTRADYPKLIDFLKAQANYNLVCKLFKERKA